MQADSIWPPHQLPRQVNLAAKDLADDQPGKGDKDWLQCGLSNGMLA